MLKKLLIPILLIAAIGFAGYIIFKVYPDFKINTYYIPADKEIKVTLEFWGLWDNSDDWESVIKKFESETRVFEGQKINARVNYTKKDLSSYQKELEKTENTNSSPNIFIISNNWLGKYAEKLDPLEENDAYAEKYKLIKHDEFLNIFPQQVIKNATHNYKIYSTPLYSDSLALYYNKELFKKANIENPPKTWKEFKEIAKKLNRIDSENNIIQSAAALGLGKNVNRSSDILALLIKQGGGSLIDDNGNIDINREIEINTSKGPELRSPGKRAILFYTEFSDPKKEAYSWNNTEEDSFKSFAEQKTAMVFEYSYQMKNLLALNPGLSYGIAPMPQLENSTVVNFSNIWMPVVSKNKNCRVEPAELSEKINCAKIAWSFLSFAVQKENAKEYLSSTVKAAARYDLIEEQINSDNPVKVFALQAESAVAYNKFDDRIDDILSNMIDEINLDRLNWEKKVDEAVEKINGLKD